MSSDCPDDIELHRPFIDEVHITCPDCGSDMTRVKPVIDCWYDSGSMPFAQWHYPFENKEMFEKHQQADFISEGVDQTRGWFYSLLAISTLAFDQEPYKNVISLGLVLDEDGEKMSKSKGNAVDPMEALSQYGADAIRWYFYVNSAPWLPSRFSGNAISEYQRKFMGTLWNTYAFYVLYANIDNFDPTKYKLEYDKLDVLDKWILSRINTTIKEVDKNLSEYKIPESGKLLDKFVDDLSNWYVRRGRERYWAKGMEQDKINAYMTLYTVLKEFCKLSAPFVPFITEQIYQNIVARFEKDAPKSVHLCDFPEVHEEWIDAELEEHMETVLRLVTLGRAARNEANIKNRQPIKELFVKCPDKLPEDYLRVVAEEMNAKAAYQKDDLGELITYGFKPQLKTCGPKFGKLVGGIRSELEKVNGNKKYAELQKEGHININVNGETITLGEEDLLIETKKVEGFSSNTDGEMTIVIETTLTPELIEEGYFREIISKISSMRKEADFEVTDHIFITYEGNDKMNAIMEKYKDNFKDEVLCDKLTMGKPNGKGYSKELDINGETLVLVVEKA